MYILEYEYVLCGNVCVSDIAIWLQKHVMMQQIILSLTNLVRHVAAEVV